VKQLAGVRPGRILVRGVNWVGDAVMSLPALAALIKACPDACIDVLARPWVAEIYAMHPGVSQVLIINERQQHKGLKGILNLGRQLKSGAYEWAVLLQNAFKAAFLAWAGDIPVRLGYDRDARRLLLTHPVPCPPALRRVHETAYYLNILHQAGLAPAPDPAGHMPHLYLSDEAKVKADDFLSGQKGRRLLGLAPGAAFGPAKCWPAENFAACALRLARKYDMAVLIFGSAGEAGSAETVQKGLAGIPVYNLCGRTNLALALALLARLDLLLTNDSGLMHGAAALGTPTLAVFGSTNPLTTRPLGPRVKVLRKDFACSPCLKPVCPRNMDCFRAITPQEAAEAGQILLEKGCDQDSISR
jgi:heptosyltransferase-2